MSGKLRFPRGPSRIPKIAGLSKPVVILSPEGLWPEGSSTEVTAPVGQSRASLGWWAGSEFLWGLLLSIVCSSVFVCLSLRSEPLQGKGQAGWWKGERPVPGSEGWGRRHGGREAGVG